jgi:enterochelin esterase family protein
MQNNPFKLKTALFTLPLLLISVLAHSQAEGTTFPVIHSDGSVTFSYKNPSAKRVKLFCDCDLRNNNYNIERENLQSVRMKPDSSGVFTFTTKPLTPEVYTYQFKTHGRRFVDPDNADSIRVLKTRRSVFVIPGSTLSDLCIKDSLHGRIEFFEIWDTACGKTRRILLYLPPGYDQNEQPYPVLYLLHGINGYEKAWQDKGRAVQQVDKLIRQEKIVPMVVVMPDVNPRKLIGQKETIGMIRNLLHYPSWLHRDFEQVFPQMDSLLSIRYRISSDRQSRAVAGLSAGAMQSCNLANVNENRFQYVGLFSPVVHRKQLPTNQSAIYWIGSGKGDIFHSQSCRFVKKIKDKQTSFVYYNSSGGHTWRNWRLYLSEFLLFIFKNTCK